MCKPADAHLCYDTTLDDVRCLPILGSVGHTNMELNCCCTLMWRTLLESLSLLEPSPCMIHASSHKAMKYEQGLQRHNNTTCTEADTAHAQAHQRDRRGL